MNHSVEWVKNDHLGEQYAKVVHPSGLTVLVCPKKMSTSYALFATKYGSLERTFRKGDEPFVTVPDGIAHFLEHKLFEEEDGSDVFSKFAALGANANAYTSNELTAYLFSTTKNVIESLRVLLDFVTHPYFTKENVQKEQGIIGQEIGMYDDNPGSRIYYALLEGLYKKHNVRINIAGTVETIAEITPELLYQCYNTFYHPSNMVLSICGNVTVEEVMAVAKETGKVFTVDQNRRTNRDFVLMRRNAESGIIGKPVVIESRVEGSRGMPKGWRTLKELGGGMMLDWGVHLIDQLLYMRGDERVKEVYCKMLSLQYPEVDDNFHLMITFESGLIAIVEVGTNHYIPHPRWYVMGETGTLQIDNWDCNGKIVRNINKEDVWSEEIFYTKAGPTKTMAPRSAKSIETVTLTCPEDVEDSLTVVYDQFLDAIEGKAPLTITPEQAMRVMKVMEAAFVSVNEKRSVEVDI